MTSKNKVGIEQQGSNKEFENFINEQCKVQNSGLQYNEEENDSYEYEPNVTMKNRGKDLLLDAKKRLESTYKRFIRTKEGTCWELAQAMDYHLLKIGKKNHHIIAFKTGPLTAHTFNCYEENGKLMVIDLYKKLNETPAEDLKSFMKLYNEKLNKEPTKKYNNWFVMSEVTNNKIEKFKRLGCKRWAKFAGQDEKDGGFMIINENPKKFKFNNPNKVKWRFNPFKFLSWG